MVHVDIEHFKKERRSTLSVKTMVFGVLTDFIETNKDTVLSIFLHFPSDADNLAEKRYKKHSLFVY